MNASIEAHIKGDILAIDKFHVESCIMNAVKSLLPVLLIVTLVVNCQVAQAEIETVVVSATRTEQPLNEAPSNITVISASQIAVTQAEHIQQQLSQAPGVSLQRGDGQESLPGIRSAVLTGAGACGNVLIMEEGLPVRGPAFCNVNELFDTHFEQAAQIEVTRGPSTSFYGSNSLTGSVNISLPLVGKDFVALEVGEESYRRAKGAFSYGDSGHNEFAQGRFYVTITDTNSFRENADYQQHKISWRHQQELGSWRVNAGFTATQLDQETAGFIVGLDSYLDETLARENPNPEAFRDTDSFRAWARFNTETRSGKTLQITPYVRATEMDFLLHFLPGDPLEQNSQQGFGWQSSLRGELNQNVNWAIGLDADFSEGELRQSQAEPTRGSAFLQATIPTGVHYDYQVDSEQLGLFGNLDWQINDALSLVAGARAERLDYDYNNLSLDGRTRDDGTECGFGGCRYSRPADRSDSFSNISPKLELRYTVNDKLRLYAAAASSFRAPQATELYRLQRQQQVADLDSVQADNVEFGLNYRSDKTHISLSFYQLEQSNVIIRDSNFFNVDGNELESQGLEFSIKHAVSNSLEWRAAGAIAEHDYASDQFSGGVNINGNEVDTAPTSLINTAISWQVFEGLEAELEMQHVGAYFLEPENLREYPGHEVFNLRASYQISPRFSATARLINLTDKRFAERADFTGFTAERYFPGAPRTAYLGVRYEFGAQ